MRRAPLKHPVYPDEAPAVGTLVRVDLPRERLWPIPDHERDEQRAAR